MADVELSNHVDEPTSDAMTSKKGKSAPSKRGKRAKKEKPPAVGFGQIFALDKSQYGTMIWGGFTGLVAGAMFPGFSIIFGELFNIFFDPLADIRRGLVNIAVLFLTLGLTAMIFFGFTISSFTITAENYTKRLRYLAFRSMMKQDQGYFDKNQTGSLTSRLGVDAELIQKGLGEKMGSYIMNISQVLTGLIIAFIHGWQLTLVLLAITPALGIGAALQRAFIADGAKSQLTTYSLAANIADEAIGGIKTVFSFVGEEKVASTYDGHLEVAARSGRKKAHIQGVSFGISWLVMFSAYALGFWYGGTLVFNGVLPVGNLLTVFFSIMISAFGLGNAAQNLPDFAKARGAAYFYFEIINRKSEVDPNRNGIKDVELKGEVEFKDVEFTYPTRPDIKILKGISFHCKAGQKVALVGPSGCGKSTSVALIERFYNIAGGSVLIDGRNITDYNVFWLRRQIGLVSQEPVLFDGSIKSNILYGRPTATEEEIIQAAKEANAYDFIMGFQNTFDTRVGERGAQLSGGQKQRIAIARAILKNPRILLLDEATSALDTESEALVQDALTKLMKGRTTILIAHRLSTVRDADSICVFRSGVIVEEGTHDKLVALNGEYAALVHRQMGDMLMGDDPADEVKEKDEEDSEVPAKKLIKRKSVLMSVETETSEKPDLSSDEEADDKSSKKSAKKSSSSSSSSSSDRED